MRESCFTGGDLVDAESAPAAVRFLDKRREEFSCRSGNTYLKESATRLLSHISPKVLRLY